MSSKDWFKIVILAVIIVFLIIGLNIYVGIKEKNWGEKEKVLVEKVTAKESEAEKAKNLQIRAEMQTSIVKEASVDYEQKLEQKFAESERKMKENFKESERIMRENYDNSISKLKLSMIYTLPDAGKVTAVLQDTTVKNKQTGKVEPVVQMRTFEWKDDFLTQKIVVNGDSAGVVSYVDSTDLTYRIKYVKPGGGKRRSVVIEIGNRNPNAVVRPDDRLLIIEQYPNAFQRFFGIKAGGRPPKKVLIKP